jgi:anti-sigma B factor antagonist
MHLEMHERELDGVLILDLQGRIVAGAEASELREHLSTLASQHKTNVILNMQAVRFIDSSGLGILVVAHSSMKALAGNLKLLNLSKRSAQLLVLTKLTTIFEIYDDEQSAINSFFPDREVKRFDILEFVTSQEDKDGELGSKASGQINSE